MINELKLQSNSIPKIKHGWICIVWKLSAVVRPSSQQLSTRLTTKEKIVSNGIVKDINVNTKKQSMTGIKECNWN